MGKRIDMIGNTHFDPVWLWRWDEALSSITATFRAALERMKEDPNFVYSFSAPAVLEQIRVTDPDLFEEIRQRVKEGRWELAEGWWLQADCYSAAGESYVRQGLYTQRYLEQTFGKRSETVFNIDSFGHCEALPQILAKSGIKNYAFWRPAANHYTLESPLFLWTGDDGCSVKAYRIGGDGADIFENMNLPLLCEHNDTQPQDLMVVFGVTDHGGAPTKEQIKLINEYAAKGYPVSFSRVDDYFNRQDPEQMLKVDGEFLVQFIGPCCNVTEVKKNNRIAEYSALNAEKACLLAKELFDFDYPDEKLRECWQDIMFNQFHDILGGTCIKEAYFDARNLHGRSIQTTEELLHYRLQAITNRIKMPGKNPDNAWNLTVWNLNPFAISTELEAEVQWAWEFDWYHDGIELEDCDGNIIPCQIIRERSVVPGFRTRFVFHAEIGGMGYRTYIVRQTKQPVSLIEDSAPRAEANLIRPYAVYDECDTWGFNKTVWDEKQIPLTLKSSTVTEHGAYRTTRKTVWEFQNSVLELYESVYADHTDYSYRVIWREERYALKFALNVEAEEVTASSPYGFISREAAPFERPMSEWLSVKGGDGVTELTADSIFSYDFQNKQVGLTVLRNALYGDLRTQPLDPAGDFPYMGQGVTEGRLRIFTEKQKDLAQQSMLFQNPPIILDEANHDGCLPPSKLFAGVSDPDLVWTVIKPAEEGDGMILRLFNSSRENKCATMTLFDKSVSASFRPKEIKTLRFTNGSFTECDMLEE